VKEEKVDTGCQTVPGRDAPPFLVIRRHKNLGKTQAFYGHSESLKNPNPYCQTIFRYRKKGVFGLL